MRSADHQPVTPTTASDQASRSAGIRLSVVIPAYNEEGSIAEAVARVVAAISGEVAEYELIVVDDGSRDATAAIVSELSAANPNIRLIALNTNQGKGAALRSGFRAATMEYIIFTDADLQIPLTDIPRFIANAGQYGMVVGYRQKRDDSLSRRIFSKGYAFLIRILLGIRLKDVNCPLKLFKATLIQSLDLRSCGFFIDTEIVFLAKQKKTGVLELGVESRRRAHGASTVRLRHMFETVRELRALMRRGSGEWESIRS
ncbi:undecaprenyl-phosphate 4-deoxy-4-formamido-L-arabinose transferase [Geobacter sp. OR-1]|uniref:glycosyltransferase family 2 protein n=1 Tax=Geobacter sp. OR-1 TaxID=1266765 RepID=UPI000543F0EB|nr:glycosyltransferase family 2 protein [Geobacter sp. OR-1]GAM10534.1 undecaprenyl-phosphate 4-deoxy-4-formamido-L-arabinose transferase [Geobacter sp. OR-1]